VANTKPSLPARFRPDPHLPLLLLIKTARAFKTLKSTDLAGKTLNLPRNVITVQNQKENSKPSRWRQALKVFVAANQDLTWIFVQEVVSWVKIVSFTAVRR